MVKRPADGPVDPLAPNVAHRHHQIARLNRIAVHRRAIGEARQPDLGDIRARQSVLDQGAHRIAVAQPVGRVAHVEMRIQRDQPDFIEIDPQSEHRRTSHRIIAPRKQG
jgi:hypothetical protein